MQSQSLAQWPGIATWSVSYIMSVFVFTGCAAAYTPPPLTTQHPAHPEALAAPALPPSQTLAYGPADIPAPQPASFMAQRETPHGGHGVSPSAAGGPPAVVGEGKVVAVVPSSSQIVVDHKEIPGFMDAMTMGYRIEPPALLEGVKAGDAVRFTIDLQQKAIVKIENMLAQRETPHGGHGASPSAARSQQAVVGEGKVIAVVPSSGQIVVDHKEIPGFMDAMTMGYRVEPPALLEGVKAGDAVRFTVDPQQKAIIKIEQMKP
ncbi:MAG: copper-binding protein [Candidatus Tectimicrobiota bacterium]